MAKNYILRFENGVIVIKHWRLHNTLRKDRYTPTNYQEEFKQLGIKDNGAYTLGCQVVANGLPSGCPSIDKASVVESSEVEDSVEDSVEEVAPPKSPRHKYGLYENVLLTDEDFQKLKEEFPHDYIERIERLSEYIASTGKKYKSHLATIRAWARKDKPAKATKSSNPFLDMLGEEDYE
jgi:Asp-tRNA(Asn)/Glu-tRNA(Gln) amidotransferase C subunit